MTTTLHDQPDELWALRKVGVRPEIPRIGMQRNALIGGGVRQRANAVDLSLKLHPGRAGPSLAQTAVNVEVVVEHLEAALRGGEIGTVGR